MITASTVLSEEAIRSTECSTGKTVLLPYQLLVVVHLSNHGVFTVLLVTPKGV